MLPDDRTFPAYDRQRRLLHEAAAERLARLAPREPQPDLRERVASLLIALAVRIAPSVTVPAHRSLSIQG